MKKAQINKPSFIEETVDKESANLAERPHNKSDFRL